MILSRFHINIVFFVCLLIHHVGKGFIDFFMSFSILNIAIYDCCIRCRKRADNYEAVEETVHSILLNSIAIILLIIFCVVMCVCVCVVFTPFNGYSYMNMCIMLVVVGIN